MSTASPREICEARWCNPRLAVSLGKARAIVEQIVGYAAISGAAVLIDLSAGRAELVAGKLVDNATLARWSASAQRAIREGAAYTEEEDLIVAAVGSTRALAVQLGDPRLAGSATRHRVDWAAGLLMRALAGGQAGFAPPDSGREGGSGAPAEAREWLERSRRRVS